MFSVCPTLCSVCLMLRFQRNSHTLLGAYAYGPKHNFDLIFRHHSSAGASSSAAGSSAGSGSSAAGSSAGSGVRAIACESTQVRPQSVSLWHTGSRGLLCRRGLLRRRRLLGRRLGRGLLRRCSLLGRCFSWGLLRRCSLLGRWRSFFCRSLGRWGVRCRFWSRYILSVAVHAGTRSSVHSLSYPQLGPQMPPLQRAEQVETPPRRRHRRPWSRQAWAQLLVHRRPLPGPPPPRRLWCC